MLQETGVLANNLWNLLFGDGRPVATASAQTMPSMKAKALELDRASHNRRVSRA